MLFKVFNKEELENLFSLFARGYRVIAPIEKSTSADGKPIYGFRRARKFSQLRLDFTMTHLPAKRYFLPFKEELANFRINDRDWEKSTDYKVDEPIVMFGLHACDINALNKLDKVLMDTEYPMPSYIARRKNMFIVGHDCMPQPYCFCRSMGADTVTHGFDLFLTDLGDRYFAEVMTDTAYNFLKELSIREPDDNDYAAYKRHVAQKNKSFTAHVDTTDLTKILDMEFQSEVWEQWGQRCYSCGSCASVCPTCYCYGVEETIDLDLKTAHKQKHLHSCNLVDFAMVAGGHNFRPERHSRLKYRYYHKHRGFVESYEEPLCVGCGRCGLSCLGGITVPDVIASIRQKEVV